MLEARAVFGEQYLFLAKLGCQEFIEHKYVRSKNYFGNDEKYDKYLLIPVFYNIKHGIELMIKGFLWLRDGKITTTHNMTESRAEIKKFIEDNKILIEKDIISQKESIKEVHDKYGMDIETAYETISQYEKHNTLTNVVEKFLQFEDKENTLFRYPIQKGEAKFNSSLYYSFITKYNSLNKVKELIESIDIFIKVMGFVIYCLYQTQNKDANNKTQGLIS